MMTSVAKQGLSLGSSPPSPSLNSHYNRPLGHWPCVNLCLVRGSGKYPTIQPGLARRRGIHYLSQQYGVCVLTTKPSCRTWGSASLSPAEAEDVGSKQPQPRTQHCQLNQSQLFILLIQTALLGANLRKSHHPQQLFKELISESLLRSIGFTLLYFKMAVMPLVPETKMTDAGKLIGLGNLLFRKVTLLVAHNYVCIFDFVPRI